MLVYMYMTRERGGRAGRGGGGKREAARKVRCDVISLTLTHRPSSPAVTDLTVLPSCAIKAEYAHPHTVKRYNGIKEVSTVTIHTYSLIPRPPPHSFLSLAVRKVGNEVNSHTLFLKGSLIPSKAVPSEMGGGEPGIFLT